MESSWSHYSVNWLPFADQVLQNPHQSIQECPEGSVATLAHSLLAMDQVDQQTTRQSIKMMHHALEVPTAVEESGWRDYGLMTASSLLHFMYLKWVNIPQDNDRPKVTEVKICAMLRHAALDLPQDLSLDLEMLRPPLGSTKGHPITDVEKLHFYIVGRNFVGDFVTKGATYGVSLGSISQSSESPNQNPVAPTTRGSIPKFHPKSLGGHRAMAVAVVGGGMAGVSAARVLSRQGRIVKGVGFQVRLYERSSQLGGRLGHAQLGPHQVGLGATYVKAKDPLFKAEIARLLDLGLVSEWNAGVPHFIEAPGSFVAKPELKSSTDVWYVGRPNMNSFVRLEDEAITLCGEVKSLSWDKAAWLLNGEDEVSALILALPVAQIRPLLAGNLEEILPKEMLDKDFEKGRVAVAFAFTASLALPFRLAFVKDSPITLVLNDTSRAEGDKLSADFAAESGEVWVLQTSTEWAAECLKEERPEDEICRQLLAEFARLLGELPSVSEQKAIHWLYGDGDYQLSAGCAGDPLRRLYLCGDWCYNGRVEGAWMSGFNAASALMELLKE
ncbi:unnamed protein product [Durusdinium trenchii]|uniref:Amine oxidase domain-containing protein n=1 Tax=Durusdinium trenchii TaxID=1381693 RepID=A0ABP0I6Z5_9DINO